MLVMLMMHGACRGTCAAAVERLDLDPSGDDLVVLGWGLGHFTDPGAWVAGHGYAWQRAELANPGLDLLLAQQHRTLHRRIAPAVGQAIEASHAQ